VSETAKQSRARVVTDEIMGTSKSLSDFLTDAELNDSALLAEIDSLAFECLSCGWWCEIGELCDDGGDWHDRECCGDMHE
jgi:hypothetical protein